MYEITITKAGVITEVVGGEWEILDEYVEEGQVLHNRGRTPMYEKKSTKKQVFYTQQIEDEEFDLRVVVAAINGLQLPPRVAGK